MNKLLTWVDSIFRKKVKTDIAYIPQKEVYKRIDIKLSVYAKVPESFDMRYLLENSIYHLTIPEGSTVFRTELREFTVN